MMRDLSITVAANNAKSQPINTSRTVFVKSGAPFDLRVKGERVTVADGDFIDYRFDFDRVEIIDTSGAGTTAVITVGRGEYRRG